ncbi:MAG: hypothetical protein JXB24_15220 [Bacteroidales bacterium]|nr:hypothetical protein [Bacteroidales bacterium]
MKGNIIPLLMLKIQVFVCFVFLGFGLLAQVNISECIVSKCDTFHLPYNGLDNTIICCSYEEGMVEVELNVDGSMQKMITLQNAAFGEDYFREVKLDSLDLPEFIITAYNRSSTYGAVYPVLVFLNGCWWDIMSLPFQQYELIGPDKNGIFSINETLPNKRILKYVDGVFITGQ